MRKGMLMVAVILAITLAVATPVMAIIGGQPDGNGHPYSGLLFGATTPGGWSGYLCSGTLIAPNVVLTAGHCTDLFSSGSVAELKVTFDSEVSTTGNWYYVSDRSTQVVTHPGYDGGAWPFTPDYGLVILDEEVDGSITPASLPSADWLDELVGDHGQTQVRFQDVGYGVSNIIRGGGPPVAVIEWQRKVSTQRYHPGQGAVGAQDPLWFIINNVPSDNHGAGCSGDSGSGIFPKGEDTVVAVHTGGYHLGYQGQIQGRITSLNHRVDDPEVLAWIYSELP